MAGVQGKHAQVTDSDPYETWKSEIRAFEQQRTANPGVPERGPRRTHKDIKEMETRYNPITQTFKDPNLET